MTEPDYKLLDLVATALIGRKLLKRATKENQPKLLAELDEMLRQEASSQCEHYCKAGHECEHSGFVSFRCSALTCPLVAAHRQLVEDMLKKFDGMESLVSKLDEGELQ